MITLAVDVDASAVTPSTEVEATWWPARPTIAPVSSVSRGSGGAVA